MRFVTLLLTLALAPSAFAQNSELEELRAAVRAMQKTIEEQNTRIATLEKQQREQKPTAARTKKPANSRSVTVAGATVPIADLPAGLPLTSREALSSD